MGIAFFLSIFLLLAIVTGLGLLVFSGRLITHALEAVPVHSNGLVRTLERVLDQHFAQSPWPVPKIMMFENSKAEVFCIRPLWGECVILISQRWIADSSEDTIRRVFKTSLERLPTRRCVYQTARLALGLVVLRNAPGVWMDFGGCLGLPMALREKISSPGAASVGSKGKMLTPGSMVLLLIAYPFLNWILAPFEGNSVIAPCEV